MSSPGVCYIKNRFLFSLGSFMSISTRGLCAPLSVQIVSGTGSRRVGGVTALPEEGGLVKCL